MNGLIRPSIGIIIFIFCCASTTFAQQEDKKVDSLPKEQKLKEFKEADASHQQEANNKITRLKKSFGEKKSKRKYNSFNYPRYYGGAYILPDGKLIILISGNFELGKQKVAKEIGVNNTEFISVKYSYSYLENLIDDLGIYLEKNRNTMKFLTSVNYLALSDKTNRILVGIIDINEEKIRNLKNTAFNNPAIKFRNSAPFINH